MQHEHGYISRYFIIMLIICTITTGAVLRVHVDPKPSNAAQQSFEPILSEYAPLYPHIQTLHITRMLFDAEFDGEIINVRLFIHYASHIHFSLLCWINAEMAMYCIVGQFGATPDSIEREHLVYSWN